MLLPPGATIGVLGSGQLGRMLAVAARQLGYRVHTYSPRRNSPTGQLADLEVCAAYDDLEAIERFGRHVDVVTFEFENIPSRTVEALAGIVPVRPSGRALHVSQHRAREKRFLADTGIPVAPFAIIDTAADLAAAIRQLGCPAILKTASFGYDGKGQVRIDAAGAAEGAWEALGSVQAVLEAVVPFEREVSVVAARGVDGAFAHYGPIENVHRHHILDVSVWPASLSNGVAAEAVRLARTILEALEVVGVLCVEMFVTRAEQLVVNELAPRPHNSGHLTIDAHVTSQFEQQVRAVCGLPLGSTHARGPAAMVNLLGDVWADGEPSWAAALSDPRVKLHLYGKDCPRPGRKMGHITVVADTTAEAEQAACAARAALRRAP